MEKAIIHNRIRELRFLSKEMTQQSLADQVGVSRQAIISIEKGKYYPSLELAFRIADVFQQPLEKVFQFKFAKSTKKVNT